MANGDGDRFSFEEMSPGFDRYRQEKGYNYPPCGLITSHSGRTINEGTSTRLDGGAHSSFAAGTSNDGKHGSLSRHAHDSNQDSEVLSNIIRAELQRRINLSDSSAQQASHLLGTLRGPETSRNTSSGVMNQVSPAPVMMQRKSAWSFKLHDPRRFWDGIVRTDTGKNQSGIIQHSSEDLATESRALPVSSLGGGPTDEHIGTSGLPKASPIVGGVDEKKDKGEKNIRPFKFALAEFVIGLIKPQWKEGQITKDAHKTIVKKVVNKVIASIEASRIPESRGNINNYLSSASPKIFKLIQAYVEKYKKR